MKKTTTPSSTGCDKKTTPRGPSNATLMLLRMAARTYSPTPPPAGSMAHYALN